MRPGADNGVRVLLVEDDALTREVLAAALRGAGYDVHAEPDGAGVERAVARFRPDVALVDMHLGRGVDGLTVARRLRGIEPIPLVFLTAANSIESILAGFEVGGDDYIVKPFVMAELLARMEAVLRRAGRHGHTGFEIGDLVLDIGAHTAVRGGVPLELTHREFGLLVELARHPGQVLSKVQLLTQVWGFEHYDLNVVEVHVSALRRKLEEHGPRLLHTIRGVGYALRPTIAVAADPAVAGAAAGRRTHD
ncbi:MAG TPA: response regulator transcription factor [Acidimicrobiia bacterium]|nr:response regulator transcription factor [Acidimicrobiia bacterium]